MTKKFAYALRHYPLVLFSQIALAILILAIAAIVIWWFPANLPTQSATSLLIGTVLGYAISQVFIFDKMVIEKMAEDARQAAVLLIEYSGYRNTGSTTSLIAAIEKTIDERLLPPNLVLELHCYKLGLNQAQPASNAAASGNSPSMPISLPDETQTQLMTISGIKCKDWLRIYSK